MVNLSNIRNFSIVAHINHGKSTLADRFIEICKKIKLKKTEEQLLDTMELERERGITIKAQCLTLEYEYNGQKYMLNLIDTPGHTDFSYEVNRSLVACDGVVLLVDVSKGIQAQTISNYNKAISNNLSIIVALNKIDLNIYSKDNIKNEVKEVLKVNNVLEISAKTGYGVEQLIENIIECIPSPCDVDTNGAFSALIIDAWFDSYVGVTCLIKIQHGKIYKDSKIFLSSNKKEFKVNELGIFIPAKFYYDSLSVGQIGFISFGAKQLNDVKVGTYILSLDSKYNVKEFDGILPKVFANFYPINTDDYEVFKKAIQKLSLNDSSLEFIPYQSQIFGFGFKGGFLGILHLEITKERLEREYNLSIIVTPPSVTFKVITNKLKILFISSPSEIENFYDIFEIQEQMTLTTIVAPSMYLGKIIQLCIKFRGKQHVINHVGNNVYVEYYIPLNELIFNFFSQLQIISNGFASLDYVLIGYEKADLQKLTILINEKKIDALEFIVHKDKIRKVGIDLLDKIKEVIPKQLFEVKIQAAIGKKIIAKEVIKALKKNVLSKCYGGDISRKKKLIEKQKIGKKKLKQIGNIEIPHDAFVRIMDI